MMGISFADIIILLIAGLIEFEIMESPKIFHNKKVKSNAGKKETFQGKLW